MQHNVTDIVLAAVAQARLAPPRRVDFGLTMVPLLVNASALLAFRHSVALEWREARPAHPHQVRAINRGEHGVRVEVGTLLNGGMAPRVVTSSGLVGAHERATVTVEPLSSRWWCQHAALSMVPSRPVATALAYQSLLGPSAVAASARTALHSLLTIAEQTMLGDRGPDGAAGWLLYDGAMPLAALIAVAGPPGAATASNGGAPHASSDAHASALRAGFARGQLVAHAPARDDGQDLVVVLPTDLRLVDAAVAIAG